MKWLYEAEAVVHALFCEEREKRKRKLHSSCAIEYSCQAVMTILDSLEFFEFFGL